MLKKAIEEIKLALKRKKLPFKRYKNNIKNIIKEIEKELENDFIVNKVSPIKQEVIDSLKELINKSNFAVTELQKKIEKVLLEVLKNTNDNIEDSLDKML